MSDVDELVKRTILRKLRDGDLDVPDGGRDGYLHLQSCPVAEVVDPDASNGTYGCDTGCEYARLEATVRCSHGISLDLAYGDFGDLASLIEDVETEERRTGESGP